MEQVSTEEPAPRCLPPVRFTVETRPPPALQAKAYLWAQGARGSCGCFPLYIPRSWGLSEVSCRPPSPGPSQLPFTHTQHPLAGFPFAPGAQAQVLCGSVSGIRGVRSAVLSSGQ